ncbi:unnamed protein product [Victoria cruziana]
MGTDDRRQTVFSGDLFSLDLARFQPFSRVESTLESKERSYFTIAPGSEWRAHCRRVKASRGMNVQLELEAIA